MNSLESFRLGYHLSYLHLDLFIYPSIYLLTLFDVEKIHGNVITNQNWLQMRIKVKTILKKGLMKLLFRIKNIIDLTFQSEMGKNVIAGSSSAEDQNNLVGHKLASIFLGFKTQIPYISIT